MNIFIFDSKVTDHVGRLATYSHYLFLFLCRLHQKLQLTKHLWLKSQSIFSSWHRKNYFIEYVTDWFQKYLNMLTMLSVTVIES